VAAMKRNNLYLIIGVLAVAVVIVGYLYYREQQKTRLEIKVNDQGLSVETN
jgi:predicted negative regulator of RcsB-dependent stress response